MNMLKCKQVNKVQLQKFRFKINTFYYPLYINKLINGVSVEIILQVQQMLSKSLEKLIKYELKSNYLSFLLKF